MAGDINFTRENAECFLIDEAEMLDELRLEEWLRLFTPDGLYWIPIDETISTNETVSIVRDDSLRREERVFHLLKTRFPAQSPRSRTLHSISSVRVRPKGDGQVAVVSNQTIHEVRTGDYRQSGLGEMHTIVARMEHMLQLSADGPKIVEKKVLLLDRDMPLGNLTFLI
jgi:3-phenylpropionate/cinnamic acid dioxygenase small subunit